MNSFLGFQGHMPFMLDPERVMFRNVKLLIYLTESLYSPQAARTVSSEVQGQKTYIPKFILQALRRQSQVKGTET